MAKTTGKGLSLPIKLLLVVAILLLPLALLVQQFVTSSNTDIAFTDQELLGTQYVAATEPLLFALLEHRDLRQANASAEQIEEVGARLEQGLGRLNAIEDDLGASLKSREAFDTFADLVRESRVTTEGMFLEGSSPEDQAIVAYRDLLDQVGNNSNLILDPQVDTYYLASSVLVDLPTSANGLSILRGQGAAAAATPSLSLASRIELTRGLTEVRRSSESVKRGIETGFAVNAGLRDRLAATASSAIRDSLSFVDAAENNLVEAAEISARPEDQLRAGSDALAKVSGLYKASLEELRYLLQVRRNTLVSERNQRLLLAGILFLAALVAVAWISRGINRQVQEVNTVLGRVSIGDFGARARVMTKDELGQIATDLNGMLDNTRNLLQSQDERDAIQGSIIKLLEEVSAVADGDLTINAEVGTDVTGAIADSFNYMIAELQQIIRRVQSTTVEVSTAASNVQFSAEQLASSSDVQARTIDETSQQIEQMAGSILQVSGNAATAAAVAEEALSSAREGSQAVSRTIEGMQAIRDRVQETSKRIKRLGESSQEIGEIVRLIGDIADRTSILALNASIQAAMAGESGRGFAVVAEEVERLAERAAESTKSIESLIRSIQTDTTEAVSAMEETTQEVVSGSTVAQEAGTSLARIDTVSTQLSQLIGEISNAAQQQASGSQIVARSMTEIAKTTSGTAAGTRDAATSIRQLAGLADELRRSLDRFRLPGQAA